MKKFLAIYILINLLMLAIFGLLIFKVIDKVGSAIGKHGLKYYVSKVWDGPTK